MILQTFRTINLCIHTVCLLINVFMSLYRPKKTSIKSTEYSLSQGYSMPVIIIVRVFQYYTTVSQILLIAALYSHKEELYTVTHIFQSTLFVIYYGIVWHNVELLAHVENFPNREFLQRVVSWKPPLKFPDIFVWTMLNTQHLLAPLYIWVEAYFYDTIEHDNSLIIEINALFIMYGFWNFFCWYVQGYPVYPIQKIMYDKGLEYAVLFYVSCLVILNTTAIICDFLL